MKKKILIMSLVLIAISIFIGISIVFAVDTTIGLKTSKTEVKPGETFTTTIYASAEEGVNGGYGDIVYDENVLELQSAEIASGWTFTLSTDTLESGSNFAFWNNSTGTIKTVDAYIMTFKVKQNVQVGTVTTISLTNATVDTDASTNSTHAIGTVSKTITVVPNVEALQPGTTLSALKTSINAPSAKVLNTQGAELNNSDLVGTGMTLKIGETLEYSLVVKGDTNGDGNANINDMLQMNKHRLNKVLLTGQYLAAGDLNADSVVDIKDILQLNKYRLGKINSL